MSLIFHCTLLAHYASRNAPTIDEGFHITAGYRYWQCGDFGINPEHPPLVKLVAAFPLRNIQFSEFAIPCGAAITSKDDGFTIGNALMNRPDGHKLLLQARYAVMLFSLGMLVMCFFAAWEMFGPLAAAIAAWLVAFEPTLIAHGALVTTDKGVAFGAALTVWMAWRYSKERTWNRAAMLGLALGVALTTKHSGLLLLPISILIACLPLIVERDSEPKSWARALGGWTLAFAMSLTLLWASYGFRFAALPRADGPAFEIKQIYATEGYPDKASARFLATAHEYHLAPESYLAGLADVLATESRLSFIFGRAHTTGVWYYFPAALAIKSTLTLLIFVVAGLSLRRLPKEQRIARWSLAIAAGFFLAVCMLSKMNIGVRHILPIYPWLAILAALGASVWMQRTGAWQAVTACLLLLPAVSAVKSHPYELAYSNEVAGGVSHTYRLLGESNTSWGQEAYFVGEWTRAHNTSYENCLYVYFHPLSLQNAGIRCTSGRSDLQPEVPAAIPARFHGTLMISTMAFVDPTSEVAEYLHKQPTDVIGGAVLVFQGEHEIRAIAAERRMMRAAWFFYSGYHEYAYQELMIAKGDYRDQTSWYLLQGRILSALGRKDEARSAFTTFLAHAGDDPRLTSQREFARGELARL